MGDVFALMIEHWYEQRNAAQAYKLVEQMRSRNIILSPYLDQRMIEDIYKVITQGRIKDERECSRELTMHWGPVCPRDLMCPLISNPHPGSGHRLAK